jgi:hypothetical protein
VRVYCLSEFLIDLTHKFQYLSLNVRNLTEEMVQPETAAVELLDIEENMIDHRTVDMPDGTVNEIVEHNFQELEYATRY